jgi:hypothetical protein
MRLWDIWIYFDGMETDQTKNRKKLAWSPPRTVI